MPDRRTLPPLLLALALSVGLAHLLARPQRSPAEARPAAVRPEPRRPEPPTVGPVRWIVAGGGPTPELNQVQIEQDVALAVEVLGPVGRGRVLFGGGRRGRAVQVLDPSPPRDRVQALRARLGELFDPRPGRGARYRATELAPDGPVRRESILAALEGALADDARPLTLFLSGHGTGGEEPHESRFETWGAGSLWVDDLAQLLDATPDHRPVRVVMAACHAGGFAEIAFRAADPEQGPAETARCGLFATTWDRVAAGCDPNPDRGAQEGYAIHFLHALALQDREGEPDPSIDLDGDGAASLLEAHTRARAASRSLDVPVTTSEVFLRAAVDPEAEPGDAPTPYAIPEEAALIEALGEAIDAPDAATTAARIGALEAELEEGAERLDALDEELGEVREDLAASLLHRWPVLDDPWHHEFAPTLATEAVEIEAFLERSALAAREQELSEERAELADAHDAILVELAPLERLARAHETLALAARLRAEGGTTWLRYLAFLACERGLP